MDDIISAVPVEDSEQDQNLLASLAGKRKEIAEKKDVLIPVPGYDREPPILLIKYRLLDSDELTRIGTKVRDEFRNRSERGLFAAVDTFIAACDGVYVDRGDKTPPIPLTVGGEPVTGFTRQLAEGLQFADKVDDADRARDVVFGLFANNDVAISQHNFLLNRWMTNTSIDVSKEMFEGNF